MQRSGGSRRSRWGRIGSDPGINVIVQPLARPAGVGGLEGLNVVRTHDLLGLRAMQGREFFHPQIL